MQDANAQLTLDLGIDAAIGVRDLIVRGGIEEEPPAARRSQPEPTFELVLSDGADCAFRRGVGTQSQLLVMLVTQGQYYVMNERTGTRHQLTTGRLAGFCKGGYASELTPPWLSSSLRPLDARGRTALLELLALSDFREMCKRGMVRLEPWACNRLGRSITWRLQGDWPMVQRTWRMVEPCVGTEHAREALLCALNLAHCYPEGRDMGAVNCFRERRYVSNLAEGLSPDVARDLVGDYIDKCADYPRSDVGDFFFRLTIALGTMEHLGVTIEPRRACGYALDLLDLDPDPRHGRAYAVQQWADGLSFQNEVRGSVTDKYPADPRATYADLMREREMRRHEASDRAVRRRADELLPHAYEDDSFIIRPMESVQEIIDEANAQSNCVASYIDRYAGGETDLYVMRSLRDPGTPLVTVEVRNGNLRQAFRSHNRQLTARQSDWLGEWCRAQGFRRSVRALRPMAA